MIPDRAIPLVLLLAVLLLAPPGVAPASATLDIIPGTSDASAFFVRVHTEPGTECMTWAWNWTFDRPTLLPWVASAAEGWSTVERGGTQVPTSVNGRDVLRGWVATWNDGDHANEKDLTVNASVGSATLFRAQQRSGSDGTDSRTVGTGLGGVLCNGDSDYWLSLVSTTRSHGAALTIDLWSSFDAATWQGTRGSAAGEVTFSSDSNSTFLKRMKDLDGAASYDGDPLGLGAGPNAAGADLEATVRAERGLSGGFADLRADGASASALSYVSPGGYAGAQSQTLPVSPAQEFTTFDGLPGDWTFRAHVDASPGAYASLYLWGADIATG